MNKLDASLLALEVEIFADGIILTENDEFLDRVISKWSAAERQASLSSLIQRYGKPDIGTHIVHALARLICRDVELELIGVLRRVN